MASTSIVAHEKKDVLLVAAPGAAVSLIETALTAHGHAVTRVAEREPDLFSQAFGRQVIVFAPAANLLAAHLDSACSAASAVEDVLRAARAPGVEALIAVVPAARCFDAAIDAIQRDGKPYVLIRSAALMEEVAENLGDAESTLWLPRGGEVRVARGNTLAETVAAALTSEEQGRVWEVPSEVFDVAGLFAAASQLARSPVRVRPVRPFLFRMLRPVARWRDGREPTAFTLAERLIAQPSPGS